MALRSVKWDLFFRYLKLNAQVQTLKKKKKYTSQVKTQRASPQLANQALSIGLGKSFQLTELLRLRQLACSLYKPPGDIHIIIGRLVGNFEKNPPKRNQDSLLLAELKVSVRVLKDSLPAILPAITTIMNNSFNTKTFARLWKIAEVTPVPKSGDSEEPCNHRPISLLPVLSKVSEGLAHRQFADFLSANKKLAKTQSGNRKLHSTETALLCVTDDLLRAMDDKKVSVIVLLDMSKAFDSVRHDILLQKLHELGISSPSLDWFHSYLTDRYQRVRIHDSVSELLPLKYGVPQGSILGPALFSIYVNELLSVPEHCKSACYVDDSKLYLSFPSSNINTAIANLNEDLNNICSWCCRNSLLINPDKTKVLFIGVPQLLRRLPTVPVSMLGIEITPVAVAKDLGIYIDQSLTYNDHVTKTASNCLHN